MGDPQAKSLPSLGFLAVLAHDELGLFGGYLATTSTGCPLQFHCTTPVKPSRAQEILYGPTLGPYLYGELIGAALLASCPQDPALVLTDSPPALAVRDHVALPVALVERLSDFAEPAAPAGVESVGEWSGRGIRLYQDKPSESKLGTNPGGLPPLFALNIGSCRVSVRDDHPSDRAALERYRRSHSRLDLLEPFERIRQAICEAQRISLSGDPPLAQAG